MIRRNQARLLTASGNPGLKAVRKPLDFQGLAIAPHPRMRDFGHALGFIQVGRVAETEAHRRGVATPHVEGVRVEGTSQLHLYLKL